ncbi:MAG: hypothetical protein QMD82_02005 [bacterium]|nr:hypothetical protein [bacterium]
MIGTVLLLIGIVLPSSKTATLRVEGRLQGIELIIQPGESTYALGALPRAYPAQGEMVYDFGEISSSLPPLTSKRIKLFVSPEVRNLCLNFYAEFSALKINLENIDTLKIDLNSKFSSLSIEVESSQVYILNISQLRGNSRISGKRAEDRGDITILAGTFKITGDLSKVSYIFNAEGSEIICTKKVTIHRMGLINRLKVAEKLNEFAGPQSILKVYGNFNVIKLLRVEEE